MFEPDAERIVMACEKMTTTNKKVTTSFTVNTHTENKLPCHRARIHYARYFALSEFRGPVVDVQSKTMNSFFWNIMCERRIQGVTSELLINEKSILLINMNNI